jgi:peptidoglycan/LPS O-acetylase OafA/YrhL
MSQLELDSEPPVLEASQASRSRIHLKYVDGLRACAALYVVLGHAYLQTWSRRTAEDLPSGWTLFLTGWLNFGIFAVAFFIAISGFCLMLPVLGNEGTLGKGGARRFFYRRARRILPPYYVALLLSILLVATCLNKMTNSVFDASLPMTGRGILSHVLLVHNLYDKTASNISLPLWSIAVECQIYLLFPLLVAIRRRFGMPAVLASTYLVSSTLQSLVQDTPYWGLTPLFLFVFALGMYAAEVVCGPRNRHFIWIGCVAAVLMVLLFQKENLARLGITQIVVGIVAMCVLIVGGQWQSNPITRAISSKPLATIGLFSYSLYLVHFPLQQVIWLYIVLPLKLSRVATFLTMATAGTALILFLAYVFYLGFERPFCNPTSLKAN